jgi:4-amino-4-deoxy-L-arabinose transferase-like glycosyltransferase
MQEREPSVLDYIKSIFASPESLAQFFQSLFAARADQTPAEFDRLQPAASIVTPPESAPSQADFESISVEQPAVAFIGGPEPAPRFTFAAFPFRTIFAVLLALIGQRSFEPPDQQAFPGLIFYFIAFALAVWAYWAGEWPITSLRASEAREDSQTVRIVPFALSLVAALIAFFTFTDNLFTSFNVTMWIIAILLFAASFWHSDKSLRHYFSRARDFFRPDSWTIRISRWTLLVLAVIGVALFFRMYNIQGVPAEPFSDHAEKLLDVYDATHGLPYIFFERNTGREFFQFYWTALVIAIFNTGFTFFSLKLGTVLLGVLTLPYIYLIGREIGSPRIGLLATLLVGMSYWGNIVARIGLRFPLYPLFAAPVLYYLFRGLRLQNRNYFIAAGFFLGLGLHGYSPFRIVPIVVVIAVGVYLLHAQSKDRRVQTLWFLAISALMALIVFLPLLRYLIENPDFVLYRSLTRISTLERPLPGSFTEIFFGNLWNGLRMLNWNDGEIWVNSVPFRPALDVVTGALFLLGTVILFTRYLRERHWLDLFLILSVPLLMMPSILSLAFPGENPAINRAGGALIPVFLIVAIALDGFYEALKGAAHSRFRAALASGALILLLALSGLQSYDLVFRQYSDQFRAGIWNTSDMGKIIVAFVDEGNPQENAWVVPYPYWVDTRLVGIWAGYPTRDFALWRDQLPATVNISGSKLFLVKDEDQETLNVLAQLYPKGALSLKQSQYEGKNFWVFFVPAETMKLP